MVGSPALNLSYHGNAEAYEVLGYHNHCLPWTLIDDFVSYRVIQINRPSQHALRNR